MSLYVDTNLAEERWKSCVAWSNKNVEVTMKLIATLTSATLLLWTGHAVAQTNTMTSGRPNAVLSETRCQEVWKRAVPTGDQLAKANAAPFVVNFSQIDKDGDGTISDSEFRAGCGKGLIKYTEHQKRQPGKG